MDYSDTPIEEYTNQSISTIHHTLQAPRRRLVVGLLAHHSLTQTRQHPPPDSQRIPVRELAKEVVAIEKGISLAEATGDPYHNIYTSLIQTHLPKLDDVGAIQYNDGRKTVTPAQNLLALAMVASLTSPVAQMLFHSAVADLYSGGRSRPADSIDD